MNSFRLTGELKTLDGSSLQGTIVVTPTVMPLTPIDDVDSFVVRALVGPLDRGRYDLRLPARDLYVEAFDLNYEVRLNSGQRLTGTFEPLEVDETMSLEDIMDVEYISGGK